MCPDYGLQIAEEFEKFLKTGDEKLIEKYSVRELKTAISHLSPHYNTNQLWYREIERRIDELNSQEKLVKGQRARTLDEWKEKWMVKLIYFASGIFVGAVLGLAQ